VARDQHVTVMVITDHINYQRVLQKGRHDSLRLQSADLCWEL